jgi:hypothetical protein
LAGSLPNKTEHQRKDEHARHVMTLRKWPTAERRAATISPDQFRRRAFRWMKDLETPSYLLHRNYVQIHRLKARPDATLNSKQARVLHIPQRPDCVAGHVGLEVRRETGKE